MCRGKYSTRVLKEAGKLVLSLFVPVLLLMSAKSCNWHSHECIILFLSRDD